MRKTAAWVVAGLVLAFLPATAAARLAVVPGGTLALESLGTVSVNGTGGLIDITINCYIDLTGSIGTSIDTTAGAYAGAVVTGSAFGCDNGSMRLLVSSSNPWSLLMGGQPNLVTRQLSLWIDDIQWSATVLGTTCLYAGDVPLQMGFSGTSPYRLALTTTLSHSLSLASGSFLCPDVAELTGTWATATPHTFTLVP
jgi:hypothetical protein